jgi:hypothetical protein
MKAKSRKVIQLTTKQYPDGSTSLIALCDDGAICERYWLEEEGHWAPWYQMHGPPLAGNITREKGAAE